MTTLASEPFLFTPGMSSARSATAGGSSGPHSAAPFVDQARQEITQIVREVAEARRSDRGRDEYVRFLCDRILRAMAAHGVIVWQLAEDAMGQPDGLLRYVVEHRIGTVTDHQFAAESTAAHDRMLLEVAGQNAAVVVPPTPGASDPEVPANPTDYPAAVVPVLVDPTLSLPNFILEVFLEPGGSPASQRGSLRFLAQMGELAGEFLRADQLRTLTQRLAAIDRCTRLLEDIGSLTSTRKIEAAWVDAVARLTDFSRVALCRVDRGRPQIIAVSHVDRIDQHSDAAEAIRRAASTAIQRNPVIAWASIPTDRRSGAERRTSSTSPAGTPPASTPSVMPRWVVSLDPESRWRLVLLESSGDRTSESTRPVQEPSPQVQLLLRRLLVGGNRAWMAAYRVEAIPGGRWWSRLTTDADALIAEAGTDTPRRMRNAPSPIRRRLGLISAIVLTTAMLMCLPIPSRVPATGLIRPLELDTYHATVDATVQTLHVHHGQRVQRGDTLATLVSRDLSERKTTLYGRRAVLMQRREQVNQALVGLSHTASGTPDWASDQEINEEVAAIDRQLEIIAASEADLVLKARRDGRVDAWRLQERLAGRPLRRGDAVLSVIAEDTTWVVDATIAQGRVSRIDRAIADESFAAEVSTRWRPGEVHTAIAQRFGPVVADSVDGTPAVILRMTLANAPRLGDQPLCETPARVAIRCGHVSIGWFLLEDVANWLHTRVGVYL